MKGPGLFSDIGKKGRDLLFKDYSYDQKLTFSTRTAAGLVPTLSYFCALLRLFVLFGTFDVVLICISKNRLRLGPGVGDPLFLPVLVN